MRLGFLWLLLLAPIIDLTNNISIFEIAGLDVTPNRLWKTLPILLLPFILREGKLSLRPDQMVLLGILVAATLSGMAGLARQPLSSTDHWMRMLSSFSAVLIASIVFTDKDSVTFVRILPLIFMAPALMAVGQVVGVVPYSNFDWVDGQRVGRLSGGYVKVPAFTVYSVPAVLCAFGCAAWRPYGGRFRTFYLGLALLYTWLTLVSTHRVALVALTGGALAMLVTIQTIRSGKRLRSLVGRATFVAPALFVGAWVAFRELLVVGPDFLRGRGWVWELYADAWISSGPMHWVVGWGSTALLSPAAEGGVLIDEPHSDILRFLVAGGVFGLALWLAWNLLVIRCVMRWSPDHARAAGLVIGVLVALLAFSITFEPSRYPGAYWMLAGLLGSSFNTSMPASSAQRAQ